jgi:hypothetical protein
MNWASVTWTPNGGSATPIPEIVECEFHRDGAAQVWGADASMFPTLIVNRAQRRTCVIRTGAINKALSVVAINTPGTIVAVLNDALNSAGGTGSGALTFTLVNAVLVTNPSSDTHNQYGMGTLTFEAYDSTGGSTDPLTVVQA